MANEFGISPRTLSRWIKKQNLPVKRGLISPKEQLLIYESLGYFKIGYRAINQARETKIPHY